MPVSKQDQPSRPADPPPGFAAQLLEDLPPADVRHVLIVFGGDLRRLANILDVASQAGDRDSFRRTAHALAGAAGAVGAAALADACRAAMAGTAELAGLNAAIQAETGSAEAAAAAIRRQLDGRNA
jgi:HPt (histidine-containing phosphotransfer) domain-containing protein